MEYNIVFVCTANRCRSVIAGALFKLHVSQDSDLARDKKIIISSAGILTGDYWDFINKLAEPRGCKVDRLKFYGAPPYLETARCLAAMGVDVSSYLSRPLDERLANDAFLVVTMEENQRAAALEAYPRLEGRVVTFREFVGEAGEVIYEDTLFRPVFYPGDPHCVYYTRSYVEANFRAIDGGFKTGAKRIRQIIETLE